MKPVALGLVAAISLLALPVQAAKEFDCPPAQEVQSQRNGAALSDDLTEKRRLAREADLARLKARYMKSTSTPSVASAEQQTSR